MLQSCESVNAVVKDNILTFFVSLFPMHLIEALQQLCLGCRYEAANKGYRYEARYV